MAEEKLIGKITHYFGNINVGIIGLIGDLAVGDKIHFKGSNTDFEQPVESMQIEHQDVKQAKSGEVIGLKVSQKVKESDEVYKLIG